MSAKAKAKSGGKRNASRAGARPLGNGEWKPRFLEALRGKGTEGEEGYVAPATITEACRHADVNRSTAYRARKNDPDFAAAWDELEEAMIEELESEAHRRAITGSDRLLEFLLKAKRPDVYRERVSIEDDRAKREREEAEKLTDEELDEKLSDVDDGNVIDLEERRAHGA